MCYSYIETNLQIKVLPPVNGALNRPWFCFVGVSEDRPSILPSPGDVWLGNLVWRLSSKEKGKLAKNQNPVALADEAGVMFLPNRHCAWAAINLSINESINNSIKINQLVRPAFLVNDGGRHHHVQVAGHGDHRVGVHLVGRFLGTCNMGNI